MDPAKIERMDFLDSKIRELTEELQNVREEYLMLKEEHQTLCVHAWDMIRDTSPYPEHQWYCAKCQKLVNVKPY